VPRESCYKVPLEWTYDRRVAPASSRRSGTRGTVFAPSDLACCRPAPRPGCRQGSCAMGNVDSLWGSPSPPHVVDEMTFTQADADSILWK